MKTKTASLLRKEPIDYLGLSFFDLRSAIYPALVEGMADEHKWHFENNNTESHMAFLRGHAPRFVEWSGKLPFPQGSVHLDVGAGEGILSYLVSRRGYHSIAVPRCFNRKFMVRTQVSTRQWIYGSQTFMTLL